MHTRLHRQPSQNGGKALARKYGERLACVRHRHGTQNLRRHKTAELIEKTIPRRSRDSQEAHFMQRAADESAFVKIAYEEWGLRAQTLRAGVYWQPEDKAWSLPYSTAAQSGLLERLVGDI